MVGIEMAKEVEGIFTGSSRKIGKGGDGEHYWGVRDGPLELRVLEDRRGIMRGSGLGKGNLRLISIHTSPTYSVGQTQDR